MRFSVCYYYDSKIVKASDIVVGCFFCVLEQGEIKNRKEFCILIDRAELDKIVEEKKQVQVKIILPNPQTYRKHSKDFKQTTKDAKGTMSVSML